MTSAFGVMVKNQNSVDAKKSGGDEEATKGKMGFNMQETIEEVLRKMKKDKGEDPKKKIPDGFEDFAKSKGFHELLESMLDYNKELFRLENKQSILEQEARQRSLPIPQVLPSEKKKLFDKAKLMS